MFEFSIAAKRIIFQLLISKLSEEQLIFMLQNSENELLLAPLAIISQFHLHPKDVLVTLVHHRRFETPSLAQNQQQQLPVSSDQTKQIPKDVAQRHRQCNQIKLPVLPLNRVFRSAAMKRNCSQSLIYYLCLLPWKYPHLPI